MPERAPTTPLLALLVLAGLLLAALAPEPASARRNKPVCESGVWFAEGLAPLALGAERSLGDFVEVDVEEGTARVAGCAPVPAVIKGKRNQKVKAKLPPGSCPGMEAEGKLKLRLKEDCGLAKGKVKWKTRPRQKRKVAARPADGVVAELDAAHAVSETIGPAGGVLETTDAGGRRYLLDVPEGAIPEERLVTLTPVTALAGLALDGLVAAADFQPAGLRLVPPATLTVELPEVVAADGRIAFGYGDAEPGIDAFPARDDGDGATWTVPAWHFSGAGLGTGPSPAGQTFLAQIQAAAGDPQLLAAICATWFDAQLQSALANANSDARLTPAVNDLLSWDAECVSTGAADAARYDLSRALVRAALEAAVERAHIRCAALQSLQAADDALSWQAVASLFLVDTGSLTEEAVREGICVEVAYEDTSYPGTPQVGVNHSLSVTVGTSFSGGATVFGNPILVAVSGTGTNPNIAGGLTDGGGNWSAPFQVVGGEDAVFQIGSCLQALAYPRLETICQTALVVRGLEVDPPSASIEADDTQQFTAMRFGAAYANVTWSASGGSIDAAGLYTAPQAIGTYTITATDVANPGSQATASVTVTAASGPPGTCVTGPGIPVTHSHGANVQVNDEVDAGSTDTTSMVMVTVSDVGCTSTATSTAFGSGDVGASGSCTQNSHLRAGAGHTDYVRITPADPTRFVDVVRGRVEWSASGSLGSPAAFTLVSARLSPTLGSWSGFATTVEDAASIAASDTLQIELQNQPSRTTFPLSFRVDVEALVAAGSSVTLDARARWLGITEILDQDGVPILDYEYCSNSGTDYRQPAP